MLYFIHLNFIYIYIILEYNNLFYIQILNIYLTVKWLIVLLKMHNQYYVRSLIK